MAEDWDLHAVVRGCIPATASSSCSSTTFAAPTTDNSCGGSNLFYPLEPLQDAGASFGCLQELFLEPRSQSCGGVDLQELYKPFFPKSSPPLSPQNIPISPLSVLGGLPDLSQPQQQPKRQPQQNQPPQIYQPKQSALAIGAGYRSCGSNNGSSSHRSKGRKNQLKRVCQVPAEALSSDTWSWRKYGQKPIKGSPYPRGYYRCSTSKGCMARKQVDRNRSDPGMFVVTYTSEHNHSMPIHRNSLAGGGRNNKPVTPQSTTSSGNHPCKSSGSLPGSPSASLSPAPEKLEIESSKEDIIKDEDDDDDGINGLEMAMEDDFFEGLEEFSGKSAAAAAVDSFPDHLSMQPPWLTNIAAATAASGG